MPKYLMANVLFDAEIKYPYTLELFKDYIYNGNSEANVVFKVSQEDIEREKQISLSYEELPEYPDPYLESLALFRKFNTYLLENGLGTVFHSSAVELDGNAYLFIGKSGAGKSTHARLWTEFFKGKANIINDDKPVIVKSNANYLVCGTPFKGKHHVGENKNAKIKAICEIVQSKVNKIELLSGSEAIAVVLNQTIRSERKDSAKKLLGFLIGLLGNIKVYRLYCDTSYDAVKVCYNKVSE